MSMDYLRMVQSRESIVNLLLDIVLIYNELCSSRNLKSHLLLLNKRNIILMLSTKPFKMDLTVFVDVSSNPGPQICSRISELDKSSCARGQSCSMNTPSTRYNHVNHFRRIESPRRFVYVNYMAIPTIISNARYRQKKHIKQACRSSCRINIPIQDRSTTPQINQSLPQSGRGKNITIAHLNVRSLKNREHFVQVKQLILDNQYKIFAVSESWLNSNVSNAEVQIEGYNLIRHDRLRKSGGGVCAYVHTSLKAHAIRELTATSDTGFQQLWIKVQNRKLRSILICVTYKPPSCPTVCLEQYFVPTYTKALCSISN